MDKQLDANHVYLVGLFSKRIKLNPDFKLTIDQINICIEESAFVSGRLISNISIPDSY